MSESPPSGNDRDVIFEIERELAAAVRIHETPATASDMVESALGRLKWLPYAVEPAARARCVTSAAAILIYNGRAREGTELADVAVAIARRAGDDETLRKALAAKIVSLSYSGRSVAAIPVAKEALEVARRLDPDKQRGVLVNLSAIFIDLGLFREAIGVLENGLRLPTEGAEVEILGNIGTCWLNLREYERALEFSDRAVAAARKVNWKLNDPSSPVLLWSTRLRIQLGLEDLPGARESLQQVRSSAAAAPSNRVQAIAAMCEAMIKLAEKRHQEGLAAAEAARDAARRFAPSFESTIVQALIKGYVDTKQHDRALVLHRELAAKYRKTWETIIQDCRAIAKDAGFVGVGPPDDLLEFTEERLAARAGRDRTVDALEELAYTAELGDDATGMHGYRVATLAGSLAARIGMDDEEVQAVREAAILHDIGKITAPRGLLSQTTPLSDKERAALEGHAAAGADFIARAGSIANAELITLVVNHHHERWDGKGYPSQLAAEAIPLAARVVALADVYDALTHDKAYRKAWTHEQAIAEIAYLAGQQFDPTLATHFVAMVAELRDKEPQFEEFLTAPARDVPFVAARRAIQAVVETSDGTTQANARRATGPEPGRCECV
jgi:putative nucleotidyltransferase with HDIG domain